MPDIEHLGAKLLEDPARQKMALDIEGIVDGGVDRQEALGGSWRLETLVFTCEQPLDIMSLVVRHAPGKPPKLGAFQFDLSVRHPTIETKPSDSLFSLRVLRKGAMFGENVRISV